MTRLPIFYKGDGKTQQEDLMKNIWCPFYEDCLEDAARSNFLFDCRQCDNAGIDFTDDWKFRHMYHQLQ